MRFWDTSALVPLLVEQTASSLADEWATQDPAIVIWTCTLVEVSSALCRLQREASLSAAQVAAAEEAADAIAASSHTIVDVEAVKDRARRALRVHPLRAADALQLGAALEWVRGRPSGHILHTFDARLAMAARAEGFKVLPAP